MTEERPQRVRALFDQAADLPPADQSAFLAACCAEDPRLAEIVMLRYYSGLTVEETAAVVGVSVSTLTRDWRYARAWLAAALGEAGAPGGEAADD